MGLWRERDFRLVVTADGLSQMGDILALVALTIRVHDLIGTGFAISALLLAGLLPLVLFAPFAGLLVDRVETRRLLLVTAAAQAGIASGLAFVHAFPAILVLTFLLGTGAAVASPGLLALIPRITGEDRTGRANAYVEVSRRLGGMAGPLVAGVLAAGPGTRFALLADAATFAVVAGATALLRVRRPPSPLPAGAPRERRAREGMAFLRRDRLLGLTILILTAMVLFAAIDNVANVFLAKDVLKVGDTGFGVLLTLWPLGMVAGAVATARLPRQALAATAIVAALVTSVAIAAVAVFPSFPLAIASFLVGGLGNGADNVAMRSLTHARVPDHLRGRVFAATSGLLSAAQIGATGLGGVLVASLHARGALLLAGLGGALVSVFGLVRYARLPREDRATAPRPAEPSGPAVPD